MKKIHCNSYLFEFITCTRSGDYSIYFIIGAKLSVEEHLKHGNIVSQYVVVVDLPLLRVAVEGSDNPVSLEKPCQASLPPDQT